MSRVADNVLQLISGDPVHVDGLCTSCWSSTLWRVGFYTLNESGVTLAATWFGCVECPTPGQFEED